MSLKTVRAGLWIWGLYGLAACSGTSYQSVEVTVDLPAALDPRVTKLVATGTLNGTDSTSGPQDFDIIMDPFTFQVAQTLRGAFKVSVEGLSGAGAVLGSGQATVQLTGEQPYALTVTLATVQASAVSFADPATYSESGVPSDVASADFNADGKPDLVTASVQGGTAPDTLDLFLNQVVGAAAGTFKAGTSSTVPPSESVSLAVGDVNGDGKADVVVSVGQVSAVYLALNKGDGTLLGARSITQLEVPAGLLLQDVDGDGKLDVVAGSSQGVRLLRGKGDGSFAAAQDFAAGLNVSAVALGDLNQDGRLDLVALHQAGVQVLLGDATAGFKDGVAPAGAGMGPGTLVIADLDSDGLADLAIGRPQDLAVTLLPGKGDGTFETPQSLLQGAMGTAIAGADFNQDHKQDLAVLDIGMSGGTLLLGNGDGTFTQSSFSTGPGVPVGPMATLDANGDGKPDLAVITSQGEGFLLSVLLNTSK